MPNVRIEIEHFNQVWIAEVEIVASDGARRVNLRAASIEDILAQVHACYRERVPADVAPSAPTVFPAIEPTRPPEQKIVSRAERGAGYPRRRGRPPAK